MCHPLEIQRIPYLSVSQSQPIVRVTDEFRNKAEQETVLKTPGFLRSFALAPTSLWALLQSHNYL